MKSDAVSGCLSTSRPCNHQRKYPASLCDVCQLSSDRREQITKQQAIVEAKPLPKHRPKVIKARELKPGDPIKWKGNVYRVNSAAYADGKDGRPLRMVGGFHTKSACAIEVNCLIEVLYLHPSQDITLLF